MDRAEQGGGGGSQKGMLVTPADAAALLNSLLRETAVDLDATRLILFAFSSHDGLLRSVSAVGSQTSKSADLRFELGDLPAAEQALRTEQIRTLAAGSPLPEPISSQFSGEVAFVPLMVEHRKVGVLVVDAGRAVSTRMAQWRTQAEQAGRRAALALDILQISSAYQDERRLRLATQSIIAAILEDRPLHELATLITDEIAVRLGEERVGLYLIDRNGVFRAAALRNISPEYAEGIARLRRQSPFTARALATHLPYFNADVQNDPQVPPALRSLFERERIDSILMAMLQHADRITGALAVYPEGARRFSPREMILFQALADQTTLAVAIAEQLEQQRDTATVEERNRLAREIHDTVAQSLAGVLMQVEMAETYLGKQDYEAIGSLLASARSQSQRALEETRRAVQNLAPPHLDQRPLVETVAEEARLFAQTTGIETPFIASGEEHPLTPDQQLALFRIAQEALNNARKHSEAHRVRVGLQFTTDSVVLMIDDDGKGFDSSSRPIPGGAGGYGLFGMEERARLLGGEVQIESAPGWGTRVRTTLPYRTTPREAAEPARAAAVVRVAASGASSTDLPSADAPTLRVLIADDHAIVRKGIRDLLEAHDDIQVVGEAEDGGEAAELAESLRPDIVLMDMQMPEVDGLEGIRRIHSALPDTPVIVLSTFATEASVGQALAAGARGYLVKDTAPADLVAAIRSARHGEPQFSPAIADRLSALAAGRMDPETQLNERERDVLEHLAQGLRNKAIAESLFISVSTVEKHIATLFHKLNVSNRTEAVRVANERGLLPAAGRRP